MRNLLFVLTLLIGSVVVAQPVTPPRRGDCGTPESSQFIILSAEELQRAQQKAALPICVRVVVTVFANNDGSNRAATDNDVRRQLQNMANQYAPHNICFMLQAIRQVNDSDLNNHDYDTEASEVIPFRTANCLNIFVHSQLPGLNGVAYDIPNTDAYLSLSRGTVADVSNVSTMGHETGHVFGLYHTFSKSSGKEKVMRTSTSTCATNCTSAGDRFCDTPADPNQDDLPDEDYLADNTTAGCIYFGTRTDACGIPYTPSTVNMMTYGRRACRSQFTAEQGTTMRAYLSLSDFAYILAPETANTPIGASISRNSGNHVDSARDQVTVGDSQTFTITGTAVQLIQAKRIVLKPGVRFTPGSTGQIRASVNPYCQ